MKRFFILIFFLSSSILYSQIEKKELVKSLKSKIELTKGGSKLQLLDSLCKLTFNKSEFNYDSITKQTINLAFQLDSTKIGVRHTSNLIFYYANRIGNPKEGIKVFNEFLARNVNTQNYELLASVYTNAGDSYFFSGAIKESVNIYNEAENYALLNRDSIAYAKARMYKSAAFSDTGNYAKASRLLLETVKVFNNVKDTMNLLSARNQLATLYSKIGFYKEAIKERSEILRISRSMHFHRSLISNLYNASLEQKIIGNQKQRIAFLKEAFLHISEPEYNEGIDPYIYYALLSAYSENDSIKKAKGIYNEIQTKYGTRNPIPFEDNYRDALADYYVANHNFDKALKEINWTLNYRNSIGEIRGSYVIEKKLSKIYNALGDTKKSFKHFKKYTKLKDSVNKTQKVKMLSYYQSLYEKEKRDFKIAEQESEIKILDQENKLKKQWLFFGGLGLLLFFVVVYLIRSRNFSRKEKENQELFSQELIKSQEDQKTQVARDLHDSVGQKLMLLTKKVKLFNDDNIDALAKNTLEELRGISRGLYPATFERIGITASIQSMINEVDANTNLFFMTDIDNIDEDLSNQNALHLYRIIQEVLNNVIKHANAKSVSISILKKDGFIETKIEDNGIGFDFSEKLTSNSSLGMKTLFERARIIKSKLLVNSKKDSGTIMKLITPIS